MTIKEKAEEIKKIFKGKAPKFHSRLFMISDHSRIYCELKYYGAKTLEEKKFWKKVKNEI